MIRDRVRGREVGDADISGEVDLRLSRRIELGLAVHAHAAGVDHEIQVLADVRLQRLFRECKDKGNDFPAKLLNKK